MTSLSQQIPQPFIVTEVEALVAGRVVKFVAELGMDRVIIEGDFQILIASMILDFLMYESFVMFKKNTH